MTALQFHFQHMNLELGYGKRDAFADKHHYIGSAIKLNSTYNTIVLLAYQV